MAASRRTRAPTFAPRVAVVDSARHVLEVTRRMHALAASPEGQTLTLGELERQVEEELAVERESAARIECPAT